MRPTARTLTRGHCQAAVVNAVASVDPVAAVIVGPLARPSSGPAVPNRANAWPRSENGHDVRPGRSGTAPTP